MAVRRIDASDLLVWMKKNVDSTPTWVLVGCATSVNLNREKDTEEISCRSAAAVAEYTSGKKRFNADLSGVYSIYDGDDVDANVSFDELDDAFENDTVLELMFGTSGADTDRVWVGNFIVQSDSLSAGDSGSVDYSVSFLGTGAITKSTYITQVPA